MADVILKATIILITAWGATLLLRRAAAAIRHLVWSAAFAALLLLPILSLLVPEWKLRGLPDASTLVFTVQARPDTASPAGHTASTQASSTRSNMAAPAAPARRIPWIPLLWTAGVLLSLVRLAVGWAASLRACRDAEPVYDPLLEGARRVRLLRSRSANMPMTTGILRPAILLPSGADAWPADRWRMVLAHELAHVRRHDCLMQAVARLAASFYWFHPLAWIALRQFIQERERASDDLVLAAGVKPSDYAAGLLDVARSFRPAPATAWAAIAMARPSQLEGRLVAILDPTARRGTVRVPVVLATAAVALAVLLPLAAMRPAPQEPQSPSTTFRAVAMETDCTRLDAEAKVLMRRGQYDDAEKLYRRALELRQQKFGERSPEFARGLQNLAEALRATKQQVEAALLNQRAVEIQEATLGPNHPEVASTVFELGLRAHADRRYAEAEQLYQRVLDIRTRSLGAADPGVAEVLTRMGLLNESLSKAADAESFYQRAISIFETAGRETPEYALAMELYAHRLRDQNRIPEATPFEDRAKLIRSAHVGRRETGQTSNAVRVGGGVTAPRVISKVEPEYSEEARIAKYQGTVVLYIEVGDDGLAHNIQLKRSLGLGLDEKAAEAIGRWRFQPGTKDGLPVTVQATVEINFRLK